MINTTTDRVKYQNMKRDPRVALLVDDGYRYVSIKGTAREATERDPKADIETLAVRYTGEEAGRKRAREYYWKMDRVTFMITPERAVVDL